MEAVGAIGSIVQIIDATAKLINYAKDVHAAEKQIFSVQTEIEVIRHILCALNTSVDESPKTFHLTLTVLSAEDGVLFEFYTFLLSFKEKLVAKPGRKLLWPFDKSRIKQDLEKIQRYKTILVCALLNDSILLTKKIKDGVDIIKHDVKEITHSVDGISTALEQQKKHALLEWLSPSRRMDFAQKQAALTDKRAKNTGRWLIESEQFKSWLDGHQSSMIMKGGGGMGKTMLASTAIDHLMIINTARPERNAIAYVFGNWADADHFSAQYLLANLLKQLLLVEGSQFPETLEELHSSQSYPTYSQLCRLLQLQIKRFSRTFIIIDALNELDGATQHKVLETLRELQAGVTIKLMVTTRDPYRVLQYIPSAAELDIRATPEDLDLWMDERLRGLPPGCFVAKSSHETHQKIKATLVQAADGMFLLAKLSMETISKISNLKKLKRALESMASGSYSLDDAYNDTMERIKTQTDGMQADSIILLSFVTHASRALTVSELEHALAIEVDEPFFDTDNISDLREAIDSCSGLVEIDPEDQTVVLAHHTAKEYFDRTKEKHFPSASAMITERCLAYLSDAHLTDSCQSYESYEVRVASFPFFEYAAQNWGFHAAQGEVQETLNANIFAFLRKTSNVACSAQAMLQSENHWWHIHGSIEPTTCLGISGLHISAWFGLAFIAGQLIEEKIDVDNVDYNKRSPLWYAVHNRKKEVVILLLEKGAHVSTDQRLLPVLEECVRSSDPEILKALGGFENCSIDRCSVMLKLAARNPHCGADMVEQVLDSFPSVPIEKIYDSLIRSSVSNHLCGKSILSMLINRRWKIPVDVNIIRILSGNISTGADILKFLLYHNGPEGSKLDTSVFELAASGVASDVMEALLDYQPEFQFNVDILPLTAEVNEEMFLAVLKRQPHFEVTQHMLCRLVRNTALRSAAMEALLKHAPPGTLRINDNVIASFIRSTFKASSFIQWLLSHHESSQEQFSEKILVAAAGSNDAVEMLGIIKSFEPTFRVTPRMLVAALTNPVSEGEVVQWLLQHDSTCRIDEASMVDALQVGGNDLEIRELLSHRPQRLTYSVVSAWAMAIFKELDTLECLVHQGGDISDPDIIDVITQAVLRKAPNEDCITRVLGPIQKQHMRITSASLKAAAKNFHTFDAVKWVLDHEPALGITSAIFEAVAWRASSFPDFELLEKRSPDVKMTEQLLIASTNSQSAKTFQWALDRSDITHITPRVLECAAAHRTSNVYRIKLLIAKHPSITITEEILTRACQNAWRDIKPLECLFAEYPQLSLSEIPMVALLRGVQSDAVVKVIKEHLPKLNITQTLLAAAAQNATTEKALGLILTFDIRELPLEPIFTIIAGSKHAEMKYNVLRRLYPARVSVSDTLLRAASENPHGPGALNWLAWFSEPRKFTKTPVAPQDAMLWYLTRDPSPAITQEMIMAAAGESWGGNVLALLLQRNPIFIISKDLVNVLCSNWEFGEHNSRLVFDYHNKHTRIPDDIRAMVLKSITMVSARRIYKLLREHNDDIDFQ